MDAEVGHVINPKHHDPAERPRMKLTRRAFLGAAGAMTTLTLDNDGFEARPGDRLVPVNPQPYDLQFFPHPPRAELPLGKAQIMALAEPPTAIFASNDDMAAATVAVETAS